MSEREKLAWTVAAFFAGLVLLDLVLERLEDMRRVADWRP